MTKAVFQVSDGERQAKLTVTVLGAAAAPVLPNVNRWRGQLGLGPLADVNDAAVKEVLVSDLPATYVDLSAPEVGDFTAGNAGRHCSVRRRDVVFQVIG